ncbi:hypothetical protein OOK31_17610 [Streptomyces sp. NBC_00249]|uniref:hypothetical protein n=1 Tax=Streptomyces sp. NBC_00249 TaxID=2975690 RepID=UPI0022571E09|nr:hypothetical protein [Streptomyces sp. NBC_00249]MCX5195699.1 hypothetical protein [Streptomyces sp. NBC_00249]
MISAPCELMMAAAMSLADWYFPSMRVDFDVLVKPGSNSPVASVDTDSKRQGGITTVALDSAGEVALLPGWTGRRCTRSPPVTAHRPVLRAASMSMAGSISA